VLPDALTGTIFSHIASEATTRARQAPAGAEPMTPREREIIDLIAEGASNKRISRELGISVHTVKSHMRNILEKLSLQSRLEVAAYAHRTAEGIDNWAR
jgi:DNA-binding CsgD family transcriptional regulator